MKTIPPSWRQLQVTADEVQVGDIIANIGIVDGIAVFGVFHVFAVRGTAWSLSTGQGDLVTRDHVLHSKADVVILR